MLIVFGAVNDPGLFGEMGHSFLMERELIVKTLAETGGTRTRASEILGISHRTLQNKLKEYGLNTPPPVDRG